MAVAKIIGSIKKAFALIGEIRSLPKIRVRLSSSFQEGIDMYRYFTGRHPRYLIFKNKTLGVALIPCHEYGSFEAYAKTVSGKNSAVYYTRRCNNMGYVTRPINPHDWHEQILAINLSSETRQGGRMPENYRTRLDYPINEYHTYWGVFKDDTLVSYCWVKKNGELRLLNRLLAHADHMKDGVMYKMLMDAAAHEFKELEKLSGEKVFIMYDTFFGAGEGLKLFKRRMGFKPYRVTWELAK